MKITNEHLLYRKWFLFSLIVLLLNDFYFKYQFHNVITGKLSDFAGLFIFPYFISLFLKNIKRVYFLTALFFIFWKSEFSQPIIDFFNSIGFGMNRIVDFTDLIALSVLPFSYIYRINNKLRANIFSKFSYLIVLISCFSFIATTLQTYGEEINIKSGDNIEIKENVFDLENKLNIWEVENEKYSCWIEYENGSILYTIFLKEKNDSVTLIKIDSVKRFNIPTKSFFDKISRKEKEKFRSLNKEDFEKIFLDKIKK